jgi:hypothetical protein
VSQSLRAGSLRLSWQGQGLQPHLNFADRWWSRLQHCETWATVCFLPHERVLMSSPTQVSLRHNGWRIWLEVAYRLAL